MSKIKPYNLGGEKYPFPIRQAADNSVYLKAKEMEFKVYRKCPRCGENLYIVYQWEAAGVAHGQIVDYECCPSCDYWGVVGTEPYLNGSDAE